MKGKINDQHFLLGHDKKLKCNSFYKLLILGIRNRRAGIGVKIKIEIIIIMINKTGEKDLNKDQEIRIKRNIDTRGMIEMIEKEIDREDREDRDMKIIAIEIVVGIIQGKDEEVAVIKGETAIETENIKSLKKIPTFKKENRFRESELLIPKKLSSLKNNLIKELFWTKKKGSSKE